MCGIVGQLSFNRVTDHLQNMADVLTHRGPDDYGTLVDGAIRLGFRRLAIVDLSEAGHQPMPNEDGTLWIVFNGEIYNYRELVAELRSRGHIFRSRSDTETIIHAYEEWGVECLQRFNGMFAFALWDKRSERLFCARDRFGVKPFYYYANAQEQCLLFASEIKALLQNPQVPRQPNPEMIYDYLAGGLLDHTDQTCFDGVRQLPAAHFMLVTRSGAAIRRYWEMPDQPHGAHVYSSVAEWRRRAAEFHDLLDDAVRIRLHADVPVGTCLSGGLDSSSIVCLANRLLFADSTDLPWHERGQRQKTFSACYDDTRHDERHFIDVVLAATGAEANYVFPGRDASLEDIIPLVIWHQDEPFGSTSILAQWHIMQAAQQSGIKVLLDGQGADELLAGYHGYFGASLADNLASRNLSRFVRDLQLYRRNHSAGWLQIGLSLVDGFLPPSGGVSLLLRERYRSRQLATQVLHPNFTRLHHITDTWVSRRTSRLKTLLYNQTTHTNLPALLHYEDRNSMAFSIESRTPFLDYRIAEFLASLPNASLISNGLTKVVLRDAMHGVLPEPVRMRLDKKGFSTPEDIWFRTSLRDWAKSILQAPSLAARGFVDPTRIGKVFESHVAGKVNASTLIWRVINAELWARMFLDNVAPPGRPFISEQYRTAAALSRTK